MFRCIVVSAEVPQGLKLNGIAVGASCNTNLFAGDTSIFSVKRDVDTSANKSINGMLKFHTKKIS